MAVSLTPTSSSPDRTLRTYARYANGKLIPGSMIARRTPPKGNNWVEIPKSLCCVETTTLPPT